MERYELKKLADDTDNLSNRALDILEALAKRHANGEYDEDDMEALAAITSMATCFELVVRESHRTIALIYPNS